MNVPVNVASREVLQMLVKMVCGRRRNIFTMLPRKLFDLCWVRITTKSTMRTRIMVHLQQPQLLLIPRQVLVTSSPKPTIRRHILYSHKTPCHRRYRRGCPMAVNNHLCRQLSNSQVTSPHFKELRYRKSRMMAKELLAEHCLIQVTPPSSTLTWRG